MITPTHKHCVNCSRPFKRSKADTTVRCPDCRKGGRKRPDPCPVCADELVIHSLHADGHIYTTPCYSQRHQQGA